uniref:Serine/threonine-protein phosphatase n=1 Tax=Alexandrium andersonii TaxID=327968 RepID=A0A7S2D4F4_9DINO
MGSNCCRASSTELVGEKRTEKTDAILQGLQNEEVKRKVQELEDLAFMGSTGLVHQRVDSRGDEEAFFVGVLERLENSDEFDSNSPFTSEIGDDDSDGDVVGHANSEKRSRVCSSTVDDNVYVMPEVGSVEEDLPLAEWELGAAWNQLRHCELPKLGICTRLIQGVARLYAAGSALVHLPAPPLNGRVVIVGDLHGHFGDLCHILDAFGEPSAGPGGTQYLFNGDFVDRGSWGPELLLTLYCLKLRHPRAVHFNRGNHEDIKQNQMPANGFRDAHCTRAFGKDGPQVFKLCLRSFGQLPLCHVLNNEIAVIHGGLPLDPSVTLSDIETIRRQREIPAHLYTVHGYREGQRIKARRLIPTTSGHLIEPGSLGQLLRRHMRTNCAIAQFVLMWRLRSCPSEPGSIKWPEVVGMSLLALMRWPSL